MLPFFSGRFWGFFFLMPCSKIPALCQQISLIIITPGKLFPAMQPIILYCPISPGVFIHGWVPSRKALRHLSSPCGILMRIVGLLWLPIRYQPLFILLICCFFSCLCQMLPPFSHFYGCSSLPWACLPYAYRGDCPDNRLFWAQLFMGSAGFMFPGCQTILRSQ